MCKFITGIDDFGTMTGVSQGWTFISFDKRFYADFEQKAELILNESKLKSFHGKEFKRKKVEYYKKFLVLIRETLEKGESSVACATLLDESWKQNFNSFIDKVMKGAFKQAGIQDKKFISGSQFLAKPILAYIKVASSSITASSTSIHIDYHALLKEFDDIDLIIKNKKIIPQLPVIAAVNAYRKHKFNLAPNIERDSIKILNDENSFVIQAADILGNFSSALVFKVLGKITKTNDLKAKIITDIFGDLIDTSDIPNMVELVGDDFKLKESGSFTFTLN